MASRSRAVLIVCWFPPSRTSHTASGKTNSWVWWPKKVPVRSPAQVPDPPPRPSSHASGSNTMYTEAGLLPGGSQPLVSMMGALGKPHSCLIGHFSNRRLASGLSRWSVQNFEWCHTHGDILIWGSPSLLLLLPCILHSISPNTDLAHPNLILESPLRGPEWTHCRMLGRMKAFLKYQVKMKCLRLLSCYLHLPCSRFHRMHYTNCIVIPSVEKTWFCCEKNIFREFWPEQIRLNWFPR